MRPNEPETQRPRREADDEREKRRVPAEPIPQRPGEPPIGNGAVDEPAAFPPHN